MSGWTIAAVLFAIVLAVVIVGSILWFPPIIMAYGILGIVVLAAILEMMD